MSSAERVVVAGFLLIVVWTIGTVLFVLWWRWRHRTTGKRPPVKTAPAPRPDPWPTRRHPSPPPVVPPAMVWPLVLSDTGRSVGIETPLPHLVAANCRRSDAFFHGRYEHVDSAGRTGRTSVRGAVLRGLAHAMNDTEGQDAIGVCWDAGRAALYLAVADGLGSYPDSGRVAMTAVEAALGYSRTRPAGKEFAGLGTELFARIAETLREPASADGAPRQGLTTLVVAEILPRDDGAEITVHGVGDSELWLLEDSVWSPIHHERASIADNATRELPHHPAPLTHTGYVPCGAVVLAATDGFASALGEGSPLASELARYWAKPPLPLEFVNHVAFLDDYWNDDRGVVALWIGQR